MKSLQKASKFLSDYTSAVVILIAVVTFFVPGMMGWVNYQLFTDPVANKFTSQSHNHWCDYVQYGTDINNERFSDSGAETF